MQTFMVPSNMAPLVKVVKSAYKVSGPSGLSLSQSL